MKILVNAHKCEIVKTPVNEKEINITKCEFEFSEEITDSYVKDVYFTLNDTTIKVANIQNNECDIPYEVLIHKGMVEIGVVAYLVENEQEIKRYNPSPVFIDTWVGSLKDNFDNYEKITPTDKEQLEQELNDGLQEISEAVSTITTAVQQANTLDLDVSKSGKIATVELTKKDGTIKTVTLSDGTSLEFNWNGTSLGIKTDDDADYTYVDLQGIQGEQGPMGAPFTIKKTYSSVAEMNADFNNMQVGDYVMIASTVEVEDNAKLYTKGEEAWIFITDFSGATGIQGPTGLTPNIQIGTVTSGETPSVTRSGSNENPVLNFVLEKGEAGETGQTGATGNGIASIEKTSTSGVNDLYTITYTNGQTTTFIVTNGEVSLEQLNYYRMIENALPKVTGTGTSITLNDTAECPMKIELEPSELSQVAEPTPSSPQDIHTISGDNTITVQGKNLFDEKNIYVGYYDQNNASLTAGNSYRTMIINNLPAGTYTFSTTLINCRLLRWWGDNQNHNLAINTNVLTFTTTTQNKVLISFRKDPTSDITEKFNTQLEKGNIATSYVPYKEMQTLPLNLGDLEYCKIGDYSDKFFKNTIDSEDYDSTLELNKWYLKKNIGKVVLDGSENWSTHVSKDWGSICYLNYIGVLKSVPIVSNYFTYDRGLPNITSSNAIGKISNNQYMDDYLYIGSANSNKTELKTWLSTHNTVVYYPIATPTYTLLNDTLQTEIDNIYEWAKSYQEQTNISQTNADLPFIMNSKAIRDMSDIFDLISGE